MSDRKPLKISFAIYAALFTNICTAIPRLFSERLDIDYPFNCGIYQIHIKMKLIALISEKLDLIDDINYLNEIYTLTIIY